MKHQFVEHIPERLENGVIYISIEFDTAVHSCACGCGVEVVTPLSPAEWALTYDGRSVSLSPSIGNWDFPCKSHYWIRGGKVQWSTRFTDDKIDAVRKKDRADREKTYGKMPLSTPNAETIEVEATIDVSDQKPDFWAILKRPFS